MMMRNSNTTLGGRRAFRDVTNSKANDENVKIGNKKNNASFMGKKGEVPMKIARTKSTSVNVLQQQQQQQPLKDKTNDHVEVNQISMGVNQMGMPPQRSFTELFASEPSSQHLMYTNSNEEEYSYQYTGHVDDIDAHETDNPLYVTDYVQDMYAHFRQQEVEKQVNPNYMEQQNYINSKMRAILIDWLVEVHLRFKLVPETLYLCTSLIDRYLSKKEVTRSRLQLVGVTALFIASKYEEIYPPELRDLVYICDSAYTKEEMVQMEELILKALHYKVTIPSAHTFLIRFLKAAHADKRMVQLSYYILDGSLTSYNLLQYRPSQLAAASIFVARRTIGRNSWSPTLLRYTQYKAQEIASIAREILIAKQSGSKSGDNSGSDLNAVNNKYASHRYGGASKIDFVIDF